MDLNDRTENIMKKAGTLSIVSQKDSCLQFLINDRKVYFNKKFLNYYSKNFTMKWSYGLVNAMSESRVNPHKDFYEGTSKSCAYFGIGCQQGVNLVVIKGQYLKGQHISKSRIVAFTEGLTYTESKKSSNSSLKFSLEEGIPSFKRDEAFIVLTSNGSVFFKTLVMDETLFLRGQCLIGITDKIVQKKGFFRKEFEEINGSGMVIYDSCSNIAYDRRPNIGSSITCALAMMILFTVITSFVMMQTLSPELEQMLREILNNN